MLPGEIWTCKNGKLGLWMTETDPIQQMLRDWGKHSIKCSVALKLFSVQSFQFQQSNQLRIISKKWWKLAWNPVSFHELMSPHATCAPFVLLCTESTCPSHFATPEALGSWSRSPPKSWEVPPQTPREIWRNRNKKRWRCWSKCWVLRLESLFKLCSKTKELKNQPTCPSRIRSTSK